MTGWPVRVLLVLVAASAVCVPSMAQPTALELFRDGASDYRIVTTREHERAAGLLRDTLHGVTGCALTVHVDPAEATDREIVVGFVGRRPDEEAAAVRANLRPGGFAIFTRGERLFIVGGPDRGTIHGVAGFLEGPLQCRHYAPGAVILPERKTVRLPAIDRVENPVNSYRAVHGDFARNRAYREWNRLHVIGDMFPRGFYVHTFHRLVPRETYFASHPEYYALVGGRRHHDQPCLSHPDVFRLAVDGLKKAMAEQPAKRVWSVSQNDNPVYCRCPDCEKVIAEEGSPTGPVIRFVNRVAAEFPDKTISTLAYQFSRAAPKVTRPAKNVQVMLCTIELSRSRPIATDPASADFRRDIEGWSRLTDEIYLWDYTVNFHHQVCPFPNLHVLQENIRYFCAHGVRQHFQQTNTGTGHEFSELKGYLLAKLLWNPDLDVDAVMTDFLEGYYGKAAKPLRGYIDRLQARLVESGGGLDIYAHPTAYAKTFLSAEAMAEYEALFDDAERLVASSPAHLARVRTARLPIQYAAMEIGKADMFGSRGWHREDGSRFTPRPRMLRMLERFHTHCKAVGVRNLNERGLTPQKYFETTRRFVDVKVEGNPAFRRPVTAAPPAARKYGGGDPRLLTDGVRGANDFKAHWLGWQGVDCKVQVDLGTVCTPKSVAISSLYDSKSWILHPARVRCRVSADGIDYRVVGEQKIEGEQRTGDVTRTYRFTKNLAGIRYIAFDITGTQRLPDWHISAGGRSWFFLDEIVVEAADLR